jgi:hypothetical protein
VDRPASHWRHTNLPQHATRSIHAYPAQCLVPFGFWNLGKILKYERVSSNRLMHESRFIKAQYPNKSFTLTDLISFRFHNINALVTALLRNGGFVSNVTMWFRMGAALRGSLGFGIGSSRRERMGAEAKAVARRYCRRLGPRIRGLSHI